MEHKIILFDIYSGQIKPTLYIITFMFARKKCKRKKQEKCCSCGTGVSDHCGVGKLPVMYNSLMSIESVLEFN